ncbi:MAG: PRC-barrel domain containing protein [Gaiellaceae bacterium]
MQTDVWTYRDKSRLGKDIAGADIAGYSVEAIDGSIGKVDEATYDAGSSYLIVDTGPWIFGKKVMLPAGVVQRIDDTDELVFVNRTKDEIKSSPEFDVSMVTDDSYRGRLGSYYGPGGQAHRDWDDTL